MLNKEDIEISDIEIPIPLNTKLLEREYRDLYIRHKILLGEKQNLIEKLEKDIKNDYHITEYIYDGDKIKMASGIPTKSYAKEILAILKGEKHEQ